jgi:hypothetical protein
VFDRVSAHQPDSPVDSPDDHYHFEVGAAGPAKDLVKVSIKDWDTDLDHVTEAHSDPVIAANDVYNAEVFPG